MQEGTRRRAGVLSDFSKRGRKRKRGLTSSPTQIGGEDQKPKAFFGFSSPRTVGQGATSLSNS